MTGKVKTFRKSGNEKPFKQTPREACKGISRGFSYRADQTVGRDRLILAKAPQGSVTYTYKPNGLVESVRSLNSDGVTEIYDYNALNLPTGISAGSQSYNLTYDAVGNLTYQTYPNGTAVTYIYDNLNRLTAVKTLLTSNSSFLTDFEYSLGASGNRTSVTETGGRAVTWIPDDLYRLTSEGITNSTVNGSVSYVMDNVGNRLIRSSNITAIPTQTFSGAYDSNDRCTATGFTWDANGNMLTDLQGRIFTYDPLNRLTRVQGTNLDVQYVYNADNLRVKKINNITTVTTEYHWDMANVTGYPQVLEELEGGAVVCRYAYGPTGVLSQSRKVNGAWVTSYFGKDAQSVRFLMDGSGNITDSWTWDAYGNLLGRTGTTNCALGFGGEFGDSDTSLVYLRARWYFPNVGRFLTMDSFEGDKENPLSFNKYIFTYADPTNKYDPTGNQTIGDGFEGNKLLQDKLPATTARVLAGEPGPDVSQALNGTLSNVEQTFRRWSRVQKIEAAKEMYSLAGASRAWDIMPLMLVGFGSDSIDGEDAGWGRWKGTVSVNGKCFYAGSVNYALWGKMNKLAYDFLQVAGSLGGGLDPRDYTTRNAVDKVLLWKQTMYNDTGEHTSEAVAFTVYGYSGYLSSNGLKCKPTGKTVHSSSFNWVWEPNQSR